VHFADVFVVAVEVILAGFELFLEDIVLDCGFVEVGLGLGKFLVESADLE
jgi:hypothetical protein